LVFQHVVLPILERHCVECHGPEKQKGKLRLDTLDELLKGGEGGGAIVAGSAAQSSLIKRMLLPVTDDERMPPEGKPSPPPEELALIQFWLDRGASPALKVKDALAPSASRALLERAAGGAPAPGEQAPTARATPASSSAGVGSAPSASAAAPNGELGTSPSDATGASPKGASPNDATGASASDVAASPTATAALAAGQAPASSGAPGAGVDGARFLATYCVKCHGPQKVKGKLRVDSLSALLAGGAEGPALVPGSPEQSSVVTRSRLPLSNDEHMPPPKEPQPSAAEVAAFAAWVRAGAGGPGAGKLAHPSAAAVVAGKTSAPSEVATAPSAALEATSPAAASERGGEPSASAQGATGAAATGASASGAIATAVKPAPPLAPTEHVALFHDAVQPLLAAKCGKCHIKTKPAGGLDVKSHASLMEGGYSGPGVVAKDRKNSPLLARLLLPEDDDERMPPAGEPGLSADEIELIGAWIEQGAPAEGPTLVAALPAGAVRALSALGVQAAPAPLAPRAGGCAACTVPGAPRSGLLGAQALGAGALALALLARRRRRR
jgi:Planctomycete cytochrome C